MIMAMDPDHTRPHQSRPAPQPMGYGGAPLVESMTIHTRPRVTRRGNPVVPPDPGTPASRLLAVLLTIVLAGSAILWQNIGQERRDDLIKAPPLPVQVQAADEPAPGGMTDMMARAMLRLRGFAAGEPSAGESLMTNIVATADSAPDRVRVVIAEAELVGERAALDRIGAVRDHLLALDLDAELSGEDLEAAEANRELALEELDILESIYTAGPDSLDPAARDRLTARYGDLGAFALAHGGPESARDAAVGGAGPLMLLGLGVMAIVGFGLLVGSVLLVYGIVWYADRRTVMRCEKPMPGGSVMLETYALFVGCFALMSFGGAVAEAHGSEAVRQAVGVAQLPAQWLLTVTVLWPLVRGMSGRDWRRAVGLTRGQGVAREAVCGLLVYLASVPLYLIGVVITMLLMMLWEVVRRQQGAGGEPAPISNPIFELVATRNVVVIALVFTLATVWAPITEELIFRGALYRHLRGRLHWVVAALLSAALFAYLHAYGPLMVAPLIALGFMFAFMREWRGSIIAPMTAHFLHNATLLTLAITAVWIIG
jgi:membrane protease YdiL (CAAX protease family)